MPKMTRRNLADAAHGILRGLVTVGMLLIAFTIISHIGWPSNPVAQLLIGFTVGAGVARLANVILPL